jgi:FkbM family methyltransferase
MSVIKRTLKKNSHNLIFKALAGFGRSLNRFYENRNHDILSNGELTIIKKIAKFNPTIIFDAGANIGSYSLLINKHIPNCKIYSFEPVSSTYEKLIRNKNGYENIKPIMKGLYNENCSLKINIFKYDEHSSIFDIEGPETNLKNKEIIELIRGDDFINENNISHIDLLKMDIEGAEYNALKGFEKSLREGKIKAIQFEYGYINITTKKLLIDYYNLFESHDYILGKIFPKNVEFRKYDFKYEDFIGPNFIAVKKTETDLIRSFSSR